LALERPIRDEAGMILPVTENPGLANRAVARQRSGEQAGQTPAAPESILEDRFESKRIERCLIDENLSVARAA
jgi:hypothetical protein